MSNSEFTLGEMDSIGKRGGWAMRLFLHRNNTCAGLTKGLGVVVSLDFSVRVNALKIGVAQAPFALPLYCVCFDKSTLVHVCVFISLRK